MKNFVAHLEAVRRSIFLRGYRRIGKALDATGRFRACGIRIGRPVAAPARTAHTPEAGAKALVFRGDPFQSGFGQFVKKAAFQVVARLAVQHARLGVAQVQALASARDRYVHEPAFFFQAVTIAHGVFVREQALFHAGDEDAVKLQAFGRMHRHELHRVLTGLRLVVAGLECCVRQKSGQRREGFAGFGVGCQRCVEQRHVGIQPLAGR